MTKINKLNKIEKKILLLINDVLCERYKLGVQFDYNESPNIAINAFNNQKNNDAINKLEIAERVLKL